MIARHGLIRLNVGGELPDMIETESLAFETASDFHSVLKYLALNRQDDLLKP